MKNHPEERTYKMTFQPAEWVPPKEAEFALHQYKKLHEETIKDFWEAKTKSGYDGTMIMGTFGGLSFTSQFRPRVTETERNNRLKEIDKLLQKIEKIALSDSSVYSYVNNGLQATADDIVADYLKLNNINPKNGKYVSLQSRPEVFFSKLREKINTCNLKTHDSSTKNRINDEKTAERVLFMHHISELVQFAYSYRRQNHAMTARILNLIRPDLGKFTEANVRLTVGKLPKPKSLQKKKS